MNLFFHPLHNALMQQKSIVGQELVLLLSYDVQIKTGFFLF